MSDAQIPDTLRELAVPVDSLKPYKGNPRRGNVSGIVESLRYNAQYRPIVVRSKTREILAGNHTWLAAKELGWEQIAATFIDCDAQTARRIVLADNRYNDVAGYDESELASLLSELNWNLDGTGYDQQAVEKILAEVDAEQNGADGEPDTAPQLGAVEYRLVVVCESEQHQADLLERLEAEGLTVQAIAQ